MTDAVEHHHRPWWKRPPVWFIGLAAELALLVVGFVVQQAGTLAPMPYSTFLDQLEGGNVANVTFNQTEIDGIFKRPVDATVATGSAQRDSFISRVPDFGDPTLIPALRKQHVAIDVDVPSAWTWLLGRIPFPILIFLGIIVVGSVVRLVGGRKAQSGSAMPMHGMIGLLTGFLGNRQQTANPPAHDGDEPKNR